MTVDAAKKKENNLYQKYYGVAPSGSIAAMAVAKVPEKKILDMNQ